MCFCYVCKIFYLCKIKLSSIIEYCQLLFQCHINESTLQSQTNCCTMYKFYVKAFSSKILPNTFCEICPLFTVMENKIVYSSNFPIIFTLLLKLITRDQTNSFT